MQGSKPVACPLAAYLKLSSILSSNTKEKVEHMSSAPYFGIVGNNMHIMIYTMSILGHI